MKPFDLAAFKAGAIAVTRDGQFARYIGESIQSGYPLVVGLTKVADPQTAAECCERILRYMADAKLYPADRADVQQAEDLVCMKPCKTTLHYASWVRAGKAFQRACSHMYARREDVDAALVAITAGIPSVETYPDLRYHTLEIEE